MGEYDFEAVEAKWQERWLEEGVFAADDDDERNRKYVLDMFPYPSGDGLHVGHVKIYTASDVVSRYQRMRGFNVLHPMGWDAFGLPTENTAIAKNIHPAELTERNVNHFREQMQMMGFSYNWDREVNTTDPNYYRWTQWIFLQLFKSGLAYEATVPINWCPKDKTGLANEEVVDGRCERCGTPVERRPIRQWMLKITEYADRLLAGVDALDWPEYIKELQRNWIGRSQGVNFEMRVKDLDIDFEVYDSVPQTFKAQTFVAIAPEHELVPELVAGTEHEAEVMAFVEKIKEKRASGHLDLEREMDGVFTGRYADDPFRTGDLPIWVASFVVADYGTGIVSGSAHDERDFAFAKKYGIPLRPVMFPEDEEEAAKVRNLEYCYSKDSQAVMAQPERFAGRRWGEVREDIIEYIEAEGMGKRTVNYKLRDWVFSRQRYWGEPIPLVHCDQCGVVPVPEEDLPVELPQVASFEPTGTGESPLAAAADWVDVACPKCGGSAKRETNTMPQWAGSSWYWLRYLDPHNSSELADEEKMKEWLPVDMYIGGAEHAVLHLLYARFWNMALHDAGVVPQAEPFAALRIVGLLLGEDGDKMSKSRGNVINPDEVVRRVGADAARVYVMFMGPFDHSMPWSDEAMQGSSRFLKRVWRLAVGKSREKMVDDELELMVQRTVKRVTDGIERFRFNTSIAALMELLNELEKRGGAPRRVIEMYLLLLSPFAPHMAEELWEQMGHDRLLTEEAWPESDAKLLAGAAVTLPVQIDGKVRAEITVDADADQVLVEVRARDEANVAKRLAETEVVRVVYVTGRMINFVTRQ